MKAIDGSGRDMRLPNIYLAPNTTTTLDLGDYFTERASSATVGNSAIADVEPQREHTVIEGKSAGQTALEVVCGGTTHYATITVREGANDNGIL